MKNKILVVGGYGQVGKIICHRLSQIYPEQVICAGRNFSKAKEFSIISNSKITPKFLDIYTIEKSDEIFNNVAIVIMCLDQKNTRFVELCIENKIDYIDISPSYTLLSKIEKLNDKAKEFGTTIVCGVGLAPGLSNLLVKQSKKQFDKINSVDIYLMLGIGERHGRDGVEWLLNNINTSFYVLENNLPKLVDSFSDGKKTKLSDEHGYKTAYRFDLADQHIVQKTLGIETVSSRFFYDSTFVTTEVMFVKKAGIFNLLKMEFCKRFFIKLFESLLNLFQKLHIGTDSYAVKAEVKGMKDGEEFILHTTISGNNNTEITGKVASIIGEKLISDNYPIGVHYIEQLFELDEILPILSKEITLNYGYYRE